MLRSWVRGGAAAMLVVGLAAPGGARAEAPAVDTILCHIIPNLEMRELMAVLAS